MNTTKHILFLGLITLSISAFSQEKENTLGTLITDRPDATESPTVIPKGYIQVETGAGFETFEKNAIKTEDFTTNTTLIRYGFLDNLELRLGWDHVEEKTKFNGNTLNSTSGFSPLLIGVKVGVAEEKNGWPEVGLLVHTSQPFFAAHDYKSKSTGVDFRLSLAHTLNEKSSLSYNIGMAWDGDTTTANYVYTLAYGYSLSDKIGAYVELYGDLPEDSNFNHFWDAGLTYLISNSVQLDATVGTSITEGQDLLLSGGISFRLPTKSQASN